MGVDGIIWKKFTSKWDFLEKVVYFYTLEIIR